MKITINELKQIVRNVVKEAKGDIVTELFGDVRPVSARELPDKRMKNSVGPGAQFFVNDAGEYFYKRGSREVFYGKWDPVKQMWVTDYFDASMDNKVGVSRDMAGVPPKFLRVFRRDMEAWVKDPSLQFRIAEDPLEELVTDFMATVVERMLDRLDPDEKYDRNDFLDVPAFYNAAEQIISRAKHDVR